MRRRETLAGILIGIPSVVGAQSRMVARIGFLGLTSAENSVSVMRVDALRAGLRDLGYIEGKAYSLEFRWANDQYERLDALATELVNLRVDVIVTYSTPGTLAAKRATKMIPIVMATSGDAASTGLVSNLARPEANITGTTFFNTELAAKRLEILKEAFPRADRVAVLVNPANLSHRGILSAMQGVATALNVNLQPVEAQAVHQIERAFKSMNDSRLNSIILIEDPIFTSNARLLAELATSNRLLSIGYPEFADAGGLMGYGVNLLALFYRAAHFVDKILKGSKPVDMPVERPTTFDFVVNTATADSLGVSFNNSTLLRASRLIGR